MALATECRHGTIQEQVLFVDQVVKDAFVLNDLVVLKLPCPDLGIGGDEVFPFPLGSLVITSVQLTSNRFQFRSQSVL